MIIMIIIIIGLALRTKTAHPTPTAEPPAACNAVTFHNFIVLFGAETLAH